MLSMWRGRLSGLRWLNYFSALVCLLAAAAAGRRAEAVAGASAPLDTLGFEFYSPGALTPVTTPGTPTLGQQGWVGIDQTAGTTNTAAAVIQSDIVKSGSQALEVTRAANIDNRWTVLFGTSPYPSTLALTLPQNQYVLPSARFMLIDWDMRVEDSGGSGSNGQVGPFFGVEAYDGISVNNRIATLGSLGVDASTGQVFYQLAGSGNFADAGPLVSFGQWNHFAMLLDYSLDRYSIFLNGSLLKTTTFVDNTLVPGGLTKFTDADISAISMSLHTAAKAMPGTAYFDNFRVLDGIPADFDNDGDIDSADLGSWRTAYGLTSVGNADGDGDSDGNDFLLWQRHLGKDFVPATPVASPVPEPTAAALATAATIVLLARRRRSAA
jgi:hypothetical protein